LTEVIFPGSANPWSLATISATSLTIQGENIFLTMEKEFVPNINKKRFAEIVSEIPNYEGNIKLSRLVMKSKISSYKELFSYEIFIDICREYNIDYQCLEIIDGDHVSFKIVILQNRIEDQSMSYKDQSKDITKDLAHALYTALSIQLENEMFINDIKK
jgi:hypothetical protein